MMKKSQQSIFDQYPSRMRSLWIQGQPKYLEIDQRIQQSDNEKPIKVRDLSDQLIEKPQYQLINQFLVSSNSFVDCNNLYLKTVYHHEIQGLQLSGNYEYIQLFGEEMIIQRWKTHLAKYTIQRHFFKHYEILKLIGQGSHAKVYKAEKKQNQNIFAVKIFKKEQLLKKEKGLDSLILELDIMRRLDYENVIKLHEVYEDSENVYLIIDYLEGGDLFKKIQNSDQEYSEHTVQNLMFNLLNSLKYLHSKNIMHRDIKPENLIFRTKSSMVDIVIADFGLSDIYNENDIYLFQRCGTVGYVAPEILRDKAYNQKVDIFSAGVILFILLTGEMPFANCSNSQELVQSNYQCLMDYKKLNNKSISSQAQDLVKLLLEKNINQRPTAEEALMHEWFTNPKTDTFCTLPINVIPCMVILKKQTDYITSRTPLWNQKDSFNEYQSQDREKKDDENQFESKYFQDLIQQKLNNSEMEDDYIEEDQTLSSMVPKYHMFIKQRSFDR